MYNFIAPPKIKNKIEPVTVAVEETIKIPVIIEGTPKPSVQFYKDGQEIKSSERIKVVEEGEKHTLVIEKSTLKDSGTNLLWLWNFLTDNFFLKVHIQLLLQTSWQKLPSLPRYMFIQNLEF